MNERVLIHRNSWCTLSLWFVYLFSYHCHTLCMREYFLITQKKETSGNKCDRLSVIEAIENYRLSRGTINKLISFTFHFYRCRWYVPLLCVQNWLSLDKHLKRFEILKRFQFDWIPISILRFHFRMSCICFVILSEFSVG